jgi:hypothetical protein
MPIPQFDRLVQQLPNLRRQSMMGRERVAQHLQNGASVLLANVQRFFCHLVGIGPVQDAGLDRLPQPLYDVLQSFFPQLDAINDIIVHSTFLPSFYARRSFSLDVKTVCMHVETLGSGRGRIHADAV